jgi:hypothetical protein
MRLPDKNHVAGVAVTEDFRVISYLLWPAMLLVLVTHEPHFTREIDKILRIEARVAPCVTDYEHIFSEDYLLYLRPK